MKLLYPFIALSYLLCSSALAQDPMPISMVGDSNYPPYSYVEKGRLVGIYPDLIRAIDKKMDDYTITMEGLPWKRALLKVKNGEVPFVFPPYLRKKERPYLRYSDPLMDEWVVMFCHRHVMMEKRTTFPEAYEGLKVGRTLGFLVGENIIEAGERGIIRLITTGDAETALRRIHSKKLDCYVNDRLSVLYELKVLQEKEKLNSAALVEAIKFTQEHAYLAASKNKDMYPFIDDFYDTFNRQLKSMKLNGEFNAIVLKYVLSPE